MKNMKDMKKTQGKKTSIEGSPLHELHVLHGESSWVLLFVA